MLIYNCTKAAADFFSTTKNGNKISPIEPALQKTITASIDSLQWQWSVHAITVKGQNVLVVMDYQTRFSITLTGLTKGDDSSFLNMFEHHLTVHVHEMMASVNVDAQAIDTSLERYFHQHNRCAFHQRGDRSVQTQINDVVWHFRRSADEIGAVPMGVDLIGFDNFANSLLRKRGADKNYFYPQHEFLYVWLIQYGEHSTAQAVTRIDSMKAKERADFTPRHLQIIRPGEPVEQSLSSEADNGISSNVIPLDSYRKK